MDETTLKMIRYYQERIIALEAALKAAEQQRDKAQNRVEELEEKIDHLFIWLSVVGCAVHYLEPFYLTANILLSN